MAEDQDGRLPAAVQEGLERFCAGLREALGDELVSVVVFGSAARGEYAPASSDVNVMIVLRAVTIAALDRAREPVQAGVRDFRLAALTLSEEDLERSADVFPTKFLGMQRHHRLLWGKDVLADLQIPQEHLRLRCEQEVKNLLLRLRQFYLQRAAYPEQLERTLASAVSSFVASLGILVLLKTGQLPDGHDAIVAAAVREFGLAERPVCDALALKAGSLRPDPDELKRLYGDFMATVQETAALVDRL